MFYYELISVLDCYVKKLNKRILFTKSIDASHNARFKLGVCFYDSALSMSHLKFWNPYPSSCSPFLIIFIMKVMMIIFFQIHLKEPEIKIRKIWSPKLYIACQVWNSHSLSVILFPISNHIPHEGHDELTIFFQIQDIWMTLKSKESRYDGALNFT